MEFVQLQINYMDWENTSIESRKCYEVCRKHKKPIIIMEPVKGDLLVNIPEDAKDILVSANPNASYASWAIRFAAFLDDVFMVLSGMSNLDQLMDNISFMKNFQLYNETLSFGESYFPAAKGDYQYYTNMNGKASACIQCGKCEAQCPQHLSIIESLKTVAAKFES